jgi:acetolactate synthase-1/2/3 large subunit
MKKNGAQLAVYALEQLGIKFTYGIPGTHTTELYDALALSESIEPILVTHEAGASFMADATSRTSQHVGTIAIVPAAGLTHAMSGIGEAFLDGIPMLVISGGTRTDSGKHYQLHQFDQMALAKPITKAQFRILKHEDIIPTIYKAHDIAISGEPGPVFIELPVNLQLFSVDISSLPPYTSTKQISKPNQEKIDKAVEMLMQAKNPMLFLGWGTVNYSELSLQLAELLAAPVASTLQGKSAFPNTHPLYTSVGLGAAAKPSNQWALKRHDLLLVIGARFGEIATGSYGLDQPKNLIHIDINPEVFDKNYASSLAIESDAGLAMQAIIEGLISHNFKSPNSKEELGFKIREMNGSYFKEWLVKKQTDKVSPGHFFFSLKQQLDKDVQLVIDDGKHTFLASELFPVDRAGSFISPTDFNCMGYCVPAAIATKLNNPSRQVAAIVGDGAFLMTGMEISTAVNYQIPVMFFLFNDGELGQISQFQKIPLNKKTCSVLGKIDYENIALGLGASYIRIENDMDIDLGIKAAIKESNNGVPVLVDVNIDYSQKTMLTKGVVKVNLKRFPLNEKIRFLSRAMKRHIFSSQKD